MLNSNFISSSSSFSILCIFSFCFSLLLFFSKFKEAKIKYIYWLIDFGLQIHVVTGFEEKITIIQQITNLERDKNNANSYAIYCFSFVFFFFSLNFKRFNNSAWTHTQAHDIYIYIYLFSCEFICVCVCVCAYEKCHCKPQHTPNLISLKKLIFISFKLILI